MRKRTVQRFGYKKQKSNPVRGPIGYGLQRVFLYGFWLCSCLFAVTLLSGETRYFDACGWRVYSDDVKHTSGGTELGTAYLRLPGSLGYIRLSFPFLIFDTAGNFRNCGLGQQEVHFTDINGIKVTASNYQLKDQGAYGAGLYLSGTVSLTTESREEVKLQFTRLDIYLNTNGEIKFEQTKDQGAPVSFNVAGWELRAGKISTGLTDKNKKITGTVLEHISLTLPGQGSELTFPRLCLDVDGLVLEAAEHRQPGTLTLQSWQVQYQTSRFDNEGLAFLQVQITSPGLGTASQPIPLLRLEPDGTLIQTRREALLTWNYGAFQLELNQYQLRNEFIQAKELVLILPSTLGKKQLKARSGRLEAAGTITAGDFPFDNLELFGFIFSIEKVKFDTDRVQFSGQILEPYARLSYPLHEFILTADGDTQALTIIAEDNQPQPLLDKEWG